MKIYITESLKEKNMSSYLLGKGIDVEQFLWWLLNIDYIFSPLGDTLTNDEISNALKDADIAAQMAFEHIFDDFRDDPEKDETAREIIKQLNENIGMQRQVFESIYNYGGFKRIVGIYMNNQNKAGLKN